MAAYNTASDSENAVVRALITKVGDYYLDHLFNIGSGHGGMSLATQLDVSSRPKAVTQHQVVESSNSIFKIKLGKEVLRV